MRFANPINYFANPSDLSGQLEKMLRQFAEFKKQIASPFPYNSIEDYVLQHGKQYHSAALTPEERDYILTVRKRYRKTLPIKQCFHNSQMVLLTADFEQRLTYVEGYAVKTPVPFPIYHGWLELNGKVIDFTLRQPKRGKGALSDRVLGEWSDDRGYFGVRMSRDYIREKVLAGSCTISLIEDWRAGFPLLTGEKVAHLP